MSEPSIWEGLLFGFALAGGCLGLGIAGATVISLIERWMDR